MNFVRYLAFILFQNKQFKGQEVKQDIMKLRPEFSYLTRLVIEFCVHGVRPSVYSFLGIPGIAYNGL
jgi:hypothetical protein